MRNIRWHFVLIYISLLYFVWFMPLYTYITLSVKSYYHVEKKNTLQHTSTYVLFSVRLPDFPCLDQAFHFPTFPVCKHVSRVAIFYINSNSGFSHCRERWTSKSVSHIHYSPPWQLVHSQLWMTGRTTGSLSPLSHCRLRKRTGVSGSRR